MAHRIPQTLLVMIGLPSIALAQDPESTRQRLDEITQRLDEVEEMQAHMSDRLGSRALAQAYTASSLDIGGHVTSVFSYLDSNNGTEVGHSVSLFELYFKAQIDDQWSLFATPGFYTFNGALLDDPTTTTSGDPAFITDDTSEARMFLSRLYAQWKYSDGLQLQGGVVGSPHGTTNREYFIPARTIANGNLHTRQFLANTLYPQTLEGLRASGKAAIGAGEDWVEYDAYYGTEDNSADDPIYGARLAYVFGGLGLSVAANYGRGTREGLTAPTDILSNVAVLQAPFPSRFVGTRDYEFVGVDLDWRHGDLVAKTEAYISSEGSYDDQRALSTEWTWFMSPQWGLGYRFDYYDAGSDLAVVSLAPFTLLETQRGHSTEHVVGITFDPNESVRLRLDFHHNNLPNTKNTADFVNFSWSVSF
ncbi:MAG: hypothetical protein KDC98_09465 [Planctomycetes bacterium]|nr:hypothetical protein [Planctomycetota bacterium]